MLIRLQKNDHINYNEFPEMIYNVRFEIALTGEVADGTPGLVTFLLNFPFFCMDAHVIIRGRSQYIFERGVIINYDFLWSDYAYFSELFGLLNLLCSFLDNFIVVLFPVLEEFLLFKQVFLELKLSFLEYGDLEIVILEAYYHAIFEMDQIGRHILALLLELLQEDIGPVLRWLVLFR